MVVKSCKPRAKMDDEVQNSPCTSTVDVEVEVERAGVKCCARRKRGKLEGEIISTTVFCSERLLYCCHMDMNNRTQNTIVLISG